MISAEAADVVKCLSENTEREIILESDILFQMRGWSSRTRAERLIGKAPPESTGVVLGIDEIVVVQHATDV